MVDVAVKKVKRKERKKSKQKVVTNFLKVKRFSSREKKIYFIAKLDEHNLVT